jgi:seryl-tRNA synthetase
MQGKMEPEKRQELIQNGQELKDQLAVLEDSLRQLENAMQYEAQRLPNLTHPGVPLGGEDAAAVLQEVGSKPQLPFEVFSFIQIIIGAHVVSLMMEFVDEHGSSVRKASVSTLGGFSLPTCRQKTMSISWRGST